jgi:hypothetical protein
MGQWVDTRSNTSTFVKTKSTGSSVVIVNWLKKGGDPLQFPHDFTVDLY